MHGLHLMRTKAQWQNQRIRNTESVGFLQERDAAAHPLIVHNLQTHEHLFDVFSPLTTAVDSKHMAKQKRRCYLTFMDESRKRVLGILTAILVASRLKDWAWDGRGGATTCEGFVRSAMGVAERIMSMIDQHHSENLYRP